MEKREKRNGGEQRLNTRDVHLVIVWDLTTDSFILALRRFFQLEGIPTFELIMVKISLG